jgi:hypothetical protein
MAVTISLTKTPTLMTLSDIVENKRAVECKA